MFTEAMITNLEWQQIVPMNTASGHYRVEITWSLDRYSIRVWRRIQEPEKFIRMHHAFYMRTAVKTANRMLRHYSKA
jgi:hypothetical protein